MKKISALLALLFVLGAANVSAQRFRVGLRGGVNLTDYKFSRIKIGDTRFVPGNSRVGYDLGLVMRLNLSRRFHLQGELDYAFVNYDVLAIGAVHRTVKLRADRLEIPVQLGLQFGPLRLFGGPLFRVSHSEHSNASNILQVDFNNRNVGLMGGVGLNIRKFFIDFRMSGYPRSHVWQTFTSRGTVQRVKVPHDIVYGGSVGFFF